MTTVWSHLPNAAHIDRVLADVQANPDNWSAASKAARSVLGYAARDAGRSAAWEAASKAVSDAAYKAVWDAVRVAPRVATWNAWYAIIALIAYDDCAHLLDNDPEHVKLMALLGSPAAILLYPACMAMNKQMEMV